MDNKAKKRKRAAAASLKPPEMPIEPEEQTLPIHDNVWKQVARNVLLDLGLTLDEADGCLLGPPQVRESPACPEELEKILELLEAKQIRTKVGISQLYNQLKQTHGELKEKVTELESSQTCLNKTRKEKQDAEYRVKVMETELHEARKARHEAEYKRKVTETELTEVVRAKQEAEEKGKTAELNEMKLAGIEEKLKDAEAENKELKKQVLSLTQQVAEKAGVIKMMEKKSFNKRVSS